MCRDQSLVIIMVDIRCIIQNGILSHNYGLAVFSISAHKEMNK
jgi:hypothetical protein